MKNSYCIGTIELGSKVMVSDPCYNIGVWCQGELDNVLPGKYACYVRMSDKRRYGERVSEIMVIHDTYLSKGILVDHLEPFEVGVDSGQAGIFDYEYYEEVCERTFFDSVWYPYVCEVTSHSDYQSGTTDNRGMVSSSGYGDGAYDCYTSSNSNGEVVAIRIKFI